MLAGEEMIITLHFYVFPCKILKFLKPNFCFKFRENKYESQKLMPINFSKNIFWLLLVL